MEEDTEVELDRNVEVMNPDNNQNEISRQKEQADSARKQQTGLEGIGIPEVHNSSDVNVARMDESTTDISKKCTIIVSIRQCQGNGYMILILFFQIVVLDYIRYHVQSRKRKYICHSVIENTTRRKNWRRNVFMCVKEYGVMRRVGKIQIIHSIGQRVNFAKGVDNICMNILI